MEKITNLNALSLLVIKKFNGLMIWILPLTSKPRTERFYHRIVHEKGTSFVCLSQLRAVSSKRLLRKIGMVSQEDFDLVRRKINTI